MACFFIVLATSPLEMVGSEKFHAMNWPELIGPTFGWPLQAAKDYIFAGKDTLANELAKPKISP